MLKAIKLETGFLSRTMSLAILVVTALSGNHTVCETLHTTNYYPGGFAEYIRVPKINVERGVFLLPEEYLLKRGLLLSHWPALSAAKA